MFTVTRESVAKYNQMRDTLCRKAISREEVKQHLAELSMPSSSIVISIFIKHNLIRLKNSKYCFSMNETNVPELSSVLGEIRAKGNAYNQKHTNKENPSIRQRVSPSFISDYIKNHPSENYDEVCQALVDTSQYNITKNFKSHVQKI